MSQPTTKPELALRYNTGKPQLTQVEPGFIEGIAKVLEFGAQKYGRDNWRKGQPVTKLLDSCLRHVFALVKGEDLDQESGQPHWAHACCNLMMLSAQGDREDLDDRYKNSTATTSSSSRKKKAKDILEQMRKEFPGEEEKKKEEKHPATFGGGMGWKYDGLDNEKRFVRFGSDGTDMSFRKMREEDDEYPPRRRHFILPEEEEETEKEEEVEEEGESTYDDLDSQNPPSPPETPPPQEIEEVGGEGRKEDSRYLELSGGNMVSDEINDCMMSHVIITKL